MLLETRCLLKEVWFNSLQLINLNPMVLLDLFKVYLKLLEKESTYFDKIHKTSCAI